MKLLLTIYRILVAIFALGWWLSALLAAYGAWLYFSGNGRP